MSKQNKVELDHVQKMIESLTFQYARIGDTTTTICEAFLPNGFSVGTGKSACIDPNEYKFEDGCKYSCENAKVEAINTIWQLEGYLLKVVGQTSDQLASGKCATRESSPLIRLKDEAWRLEGDLEKLMLMTNSPQPNFISGEHWELLHNQELLMISLLDTLRRRIDTFKVEG